MVLSGENPMDESIEEIKSLERMSPYERLKYLRELAVFFKEVSSYSKNSFNFFIKRVIEVTKNYK